MTDSERQQADEYDLKQCGRCAAWIPRVATRCSACESSTPDARIDSRPKRSPLGLPRSVTVTRALIAANLVWFLFSLRAHFAVGGDVPLGPLLTEGRGFGAGLWVSGMYVHGAVVADGAWWRVLACTFLHGGVLHLGMNLIALRNLGELAEELFGGAKLLAIYVVSGACSALAVSVWHAGVLGLPPDRVPALVGASGAIFGIAGLLSVYLLRHATGRGRRIGRQLALNVGGMLLIGLMIPFVSNTAHVGGLIPGALAGFVVRESFSTRLTPASRRNWWVAAAVAAAAVVVALGHASVFAFRAGESHR